MVRYIQLNWTEVTVSVSRKLTQSLLCTPSHPCCTRLLSHRTASVRYLFPTVLPFKSLPIQLLLPITNGSEQTSTD